MSRKALGTLTLDLVAKVGGFVQGMDQAERSTAKWRKQVEKDLQTIARVSGAAIGAAAAATAAMVVTQVKAATELRQQAQLASSTTQEFQRYAIAAETVGINQEKLADQLKDFNEKVGEFQQSGSGGMKDFFEQIAPKIGITADAFRGLSGPQALQLYYDSLERAGASQQQMSFYLESMASDTTALIPLLRNGGEGFKLLGDMAEQAGSIMSEKTVTAAEKLSAATWVAQQSMTGFRNQVGEKLIPTLADLAVQFSDVATDTAIADDMATMFDGTLKGLSATAVGAFAAFQLVGRGIAGLVAAGEALNQDIPWYDRLTPTRALQGMAKNLGDAKDLLVITGEDLEQTAQRYATILDGIWSAGSGADGNDKATRIEQIAEFMRASREAAAGASRGMAGYSAANDEAAKAAERAAKSIAREISALERAAATWGMTSDEVKIYDLTLQGATDAQIEHARSLLEVVGGFERAKEEQEAYLQLVKDLRTDEEKLNDEFHERIAVLDAMAASTRIATDEYSEMARRAAAAAFEIAPDFAGLAPEVGGPAGELLKIDKAEQKLQEWYDTQLEMLEQFRSERADLNAQWDEQEAALHQQHQDRLAEIEQARHMAQMAAGEEYFGNMADAARVFFGENSKLYMAAFAMEKSYAVAKALINVPKSYSDAFAAVVGIPIVGPALAPAAGVAAAAAQVAQAAAIGNIGMTGMAHDGIDSVPKTGTWLLEKGERVTTAKTSARLDALLNDIAQSRAANDSGGTGARGNVVVNQTNNFARPDNRTANQIAAATARKQRLTSSRFGKK